MPFLPERAAAKGAAMRHKVSTKPGRISKKLIVVLTCDGRKLAFILRATLPVARRLLPTWPEVRKKKSKENKNLPKFGRDLVACGSSG